MSEQQARAEVPLRLLKIFIRKNQVKSSLQKVINWAYYSFNMQVVNRSITKMASKSETSRRHLSSDKTHATSFNIFEFNFVGWCWTTWSNKCSMLYGAALNYGDWQSRMNDDSKF